MAIAKMKAGRQRSPRLRRYVVRPLSFSSHFDLAMHVDEITLSDGSKIYDLLISSAA